MTVDCEWISYAREACASLWLAVGLGCRPLLVSGSCRLGGPWPSCVFLYRFAVLRETPYTDIRNPWQREAWPYTDHDKNELEAPILAAAVAAATSATRETDESRSEEDMRSVPRSMPSIARGRARSLRGPWQEVDHGSQLTVLTGGFPS